MSHQNVGILHLNQRGFEAGGAESFLLDIVKNLTPYSHYISYTNKGVPAFLDKFKGSYHYTSTSSYEGLKKAISDWNVKILILHNVDVSFLKILANLKKELNLKVISLIHDYSPFVLGTGYNRFTLKRHQGNLNAYILPFTLTRNLERKIVIENRQEKQYFLKLLEECDQIHVATQDLYNSLLINHIPSEKAFINPLGIHPFSFNKIQKKEGQIAFAGSLIRGKGPQLLLRALKKVPQKFSLKIAGDGYLREELEREAQQSQLSVEFLGKLSREKCAELFSESQFAVIPSILEPFGLVILEAMSQSCPVVAFNVAGPKEIIRHQESGILTEINVNKLSKEISYLLTHPKECTRLGEMAYEDFKTKFTLQAYLNRLQNLINKL